jgi:hypothetical protein
MRALEVKPPTTKVNPVPLRKGEIRQTLRSSRNVIGLLGLQWASIARRALVRRGN